MRTIPQIAIETMNIPISNPHIDFCENVCEVLRSGRIAQGEKVAEFENRFAEYVGAEFAVAMSSGTAALHAALLAHGVGPGDEVITTPFTFIATGTSILMCGAAPVFVDVCMDGNINPSLIGPAINENTAAILPVHLYGNPVDCREIERIADGIPVIYDACQAHGAMYDNTPIGGRGSCSCYSFYATKNLTTGEGGMVTTNDSELANACVLLRNHGMYGQYQYRFAGYNYRMTDIQGAIGVDQLDENYVKHVAYTRAINASIYTELLKDIERVSLPHEVLGVQSSWHQFTIRLQTQAQRNSLQAFLIENGVGVRVYYPEPLNRIKNIFAGSSETSCPMAAQLANTVLSLPVHPDVLHEDIERVCDLIREWNDWFAE